MPNKSPFFLRKEHSMPSRVLKKTFKWIDKYEMELKNWDKASKERIAVAVCNGAVYEPELKTK